MELLSWAEIFHQNPLAVCAGLGGDGCDYVGVGCL